MLIVSYRLNYMQSNNKRYITREQASFSHKLEGKFSPLKLIILLFINLSRNPSRKNLTLGEDFHKYTLEGEVLPPQTCYFTSPCYIQSIKNNYAKKGKKWLEGEVFPSSNLKFCSASNKHNIKRRR